MKELTELEVYKFLHNDLKCHQAEWQNESVETTDIVGRITWKEESHLTVWIEPEGLRELTELLGYDTFDDGGIPCYLLDGGTVAIRHFDEILEEWGINAENVVEKEVDNV